MEYLARNPPPPLDALVARIWYCSDASVRAEVRVLPGGGAVDLLVNLSDDPIRVLDPTVSEAARTHSSAVVSGSYTRSYRVAAAQHTAAVGVHFRPGGAFPFLGISPSEIVDSHVDIGDLWGSVGRNLRDQLSEAASPAEQLSLLESLLLKRLQRARSTHPAVRVALTAFGNDAADVRVAEVASAVGLSHRRFVELFEREVGLTPKVYARIRRFHRVKERVAALTEPPCWATFALECGYYDQSHLIREFVAFSGMSPAGYLRGRSGETRFDHFVHTYPQS